MPEIVVKFGTVDHGTAAVGMSILSVSSDSSKAAQRAERLGIVIDTFGRLHDRLLGLFHAIDRRFLTLAHEGHELAIVAGNGLVQLREFALQRLHGGVKSLFAPFCERAQCVGLLHRLAGRSGLL